MAKTAAEVVNINARSAISTARTASTIRAHVRKVPLDQLEAGTIDAAISRAWLIGFDAGVKDASDV